MFASEHYRLFPNTLDYPAEFDRETLLPKTLPAWVRTWKKIKLLLAWKVHVSWVMSTVLENMLCMLSDNKSIPPYSRDGVEILRTDCYKHSKFLGKRKLGHLFKSVIHLWLPLKQIPNLLLFLELNSEILDFRNQFSSFVQEDGGHFTGVHTNSGSVSCSCLHGGLRWLQTSVTESFSEGCGQQKDNSASAFWSVLLITDLVPCGPLNLLRRVSYIMFWNNIFFTQIQSIPIIFPFPMSFLSWCSPENQASDWHLSITQLSMIL